MERVCACVFSFQTPKRVERVLCSTHSEHPLRTSSAPAGGCTEGSIFPASESEDESCWACTLRGLHSRIQGQLCTASTSPSPGNAAPLSSWDGSSPTRGHFSSLIGIARILSLEWGFPGGSESTQSACNAGYPGLIPGEGNGYHSSIRAWRVPWTEDPGWLQSMGSQRVRHDLATEQQQGEKNN